MSSADSAQAPSASAPFSDEELAACLKVLESVHTLEEHDARFTAVRRATGRMFKDVKRYRRAQARRAVAEADRAVTERTATGSASRLDDETEGLDLASSASGPSAGTYTRARDCYVCKRSYTVADAFYHALCLECAEKGRGWREARTDLTGRRALLTGGRAKIGMHIALRLLRDGAQTTITTRFPHDAARRFAAVEDSADWLDRLTVVGIDLRDPAQVISLADSVAADGPLDILINNAAQTVRRSPGAYRHLIDGESTPLPRELMGPGGPTVRGATQTPGAHPRALAAAFDLRGSGLEHAAAMDPTDLARQAMTAGSASLERYRAGTAIDAGGLLPDHVPENSWTQLLGDVDPLEMLEVQLCNMTAPFLLASRLRPALAASSARRKYIVNVSAMEGQFSRRYKGPGHPHTNMSKAAINMLTRTSAEEMFEADGILMTAVDTGWITDERPHEDKLRHAESGWHAPLDLIDGAARVYHPIVAGEAGTDLYGCFLKDYERSAW
ncbi:SDR family oxidoreductase [Zhihengliuella flava]|uniref:NAD(P)-dependent dehydrogenase (Short-subunit alcohol dehydrogenase family) n=1 Tax=Zhihengliuella flava TaxID=1285193 RepID=A0A931DE36_9MICC|nr:SDR family oxidoreductase [Zhihengliuella flava]MBG6085781.1 NAD(P)-dependent dehydrogenase (short-subunit alcohol dehydrogenase family) [Zhihengliuella flava]